MSDEIEVRERPEPAGAQGPPRSLLVALLALGALIALPYRVPQLARFRVFTPLAPEASLFAPAKPKTTEIAQVGEAEIATPTDEKGERVEEPPPKVALDLLKEDKPPRSIEDPSGHAMDAFYQSLAAADKKEHGAIARISWWGDSIVASDFVTGTLRRRMQKRFGDAGHGFLLLASPWPGYSHNDVARFSTPGWQVSKVVGPITRDGLYGLGGVSFRSAGPGLFSRFSTTKSGAFGRSVSRFAIDYLEQPKGGTMEVRVDGQLEATVDTSGPATKSALHIVKVPDGEHELEVRAMTAEVRAFGVWMERDEPGVVLDAIGIQGCRIRLLDLIDDAHWAEQLKMRDPKLVVFEYGMNESEDGELFPLDQVESTMKAVLAQTRAALPNASCLLVGPLDRADKNADGFHSRPVVPKLAAIQRKVSAEVGCAYWDTLSAMGGFGSMGIWVQRGLGGADFTHPSSAGAEVIGNWIYLALMEGYAQYQRRAP